MHKMLLKYLQKLKIAQKTTLPAGQNVSNSSSKYSFFLIKNSSINSDFFYECDWK